MLSGGEAGYSEKGGGIGAKDLKNPQSSQKIKKQIKITTIFQRPDSPILL